MLQGAIQCGVYGQGVYGVGMHAGQGVHGYIGGGGGNRVWRATCLIFRYLTELIKKMVLL